ncbi:protein of unknown function [Nitrospira defluvii]|uniref:Uncharacterized protein n=1 Tax=Nitrospira defluvii TaxID=330214 RepID=D8PB77_9BACT|nr:protein of unknown function [Nitrospira defluvii]
MSNEERNQAAELDGRAGAIEDKLHVAGQQSFLAFRFHPAAQPGDLLPPPNPGEPRRALPGQDRGGERTGVVPSAVRRGFFRPENEAGGHVV